ncbi:MAG: hypothetical protein Q8J68_14825 [Methanolobus sp.]|uniref:hypothetical protein n=1 Tax=Methanolobus sp. TaxID=1874737 RepID=UPI00272F01C1|nr:hypothetical protein [Methanolobus sp.]MDP2218549.1 hypothetical protein [Methanolobus sp.]
MLSKEERDKIIDERQAWRNVFSSPGGKIVFGRIAKECYFYNDDLSPEDPIAVSKNNYFKTIIERLGCSDDPELTSDAVADAILDACLKLPMISKEETEEE